ncbi:hypothetical protein GLOTRDRAFT_22381, partial [Gloeophyllum trabeum ATCC 11539]
ATFRLELSDDLKKRGINNAFHASKLKIHVPNDDRRFPGRQLAQLTGLGDEPKEWAVEQILSHSGKGSDALFQVRWKSGD